MVNVDAAVYRSHDDDDASAEFDPSDGVAADPQYLLIERGEAEEHAAGMLGLPGGTLEADPRDEGVLEATLRRELREEVAVEVGEVSVVTSAVFESDTGTSCLNVVCLAEHAAGDPYPAAPDEVASVDWYGLDRIAAADDVPEFTRGYVERAEAARTASRSA